MSEISYNYQKFIFIHFHCGAKYLGTFRPHKHPVLNYYILKTFIWINGLDLDCDYICETPANNDFSLLFKMFLFDSFLLKNIKKQNFTICCVFIIINPYIFLYSCLWCLWCSFTQHLKPLSKYWINCCILNTM